MDPRWYVVQSKHNQESLAAFNLSRQGYEVFYPRYLDERTRYGKPIREERALYPGYLFVHFDRRAEPWHRIAHSQGVRGILGAGALYAPPVARGAVETLRLGATPLGIFNASTAKKPGVVFADIKPGEIYRISEGSFAGMVGVCKLTTCKYSVLFLALLSGTIEVKLNPTQLAPLAPQTRGVWPAGSLPGLQL